ncbi:LemA family protein [Enterobacter bugandensis]|uniref:LemA family protein n=1 Tax=Enterobacter bugandensis TaxID=881260 RepID=UPI001D0C5E28|nr:LemA family protein [Enterobacter bugandensis]MCC2001163.1 LemA family protein [Enterobacter bugandensis]MDH2699479.1 LemA family protein [Enterobacter bugandensis]
MTLIIIVCIIVLLIAMYIIIYNGFIKRRNNVEETWAQIDVQLKRRCDLIPNLLETIKGYTKHEQETFDKVIKARNMALNAGDRQQQIAADSALSGALSSVFALSESYPELKANTLFVELQHELSSTENKVAYSRQLYNATVKSWNTRVETFPSLIIANLHGFEKRDMLQIEQNERTVPKVQF